MYKTLPNFWNFLNSRDVAYKITRKTVNMQLIPRCCALRKENMIRLKMNLLCLHNFYCALWTSRPTRWVKSFWHELVAKWNSSLLEDLSKANGWLAAWNDFHNSCVVLSCECTIHFKVWNNLLIPVTLLISPVHTECFTRSRTPLTVAAPKCQKCLLRNRWDKERGSDRFGFITGHNYRMRPARSSGAHTGKWAKAPITVCMWGDINRPWRPSAECCGDKCYGGLEGRMTPALRYGGQ